MSKMFKLFVLSLCLLSLQLNCLAGNLLQQEYEAKMLKETAQDAAFYNMSNFRLLQDDYSHYLNGGGSMYGVIKYQQEQLQKISTPVKNLDLRYLNLILTKYDTIIKNINTGLVKPDKILVDDSDYKKLKEDTKHLIGTFNLLIN